MLVRRISFIAPHAHENTIEITLCLDGSITFDYCFEEFRLKKGEFILVDRDTHYMHSGDNALCVSFYFDLLKMSGDFEGICNQMFICEGTSDSEYRYNTPEHRELKGMLIAILDYMLKDSEEPSDVDEDITRVANRIIGLIYTSFDVTRYRNKDNSLSDKTLRRMKKIVAYVFVHRTEKITLKDVADLVDISPEYLSLFLSNYAIGFEQLLGYIRSWHAERLLLTTDMSIAEVSEESGFSATKYMYGAFDFWYKCTPGEYRVKYRREMEKGDEFEEADIKDIEDEIIKITNEQLIFMYIKGD